MDLSTNLAAHMSDSEETRVVEDEEWMFDESDRALSKDSEYWERINSCMFMDSSLDMYDAMAEEIERTYARQSEHRFKSKMPCRPTLRREKKASDDPFSAPGVEAQSANTTAEAPKMRPSAAPQAPRCATKYLNSTGLLETTTVSIDCERVISATARVLKQLDVDDVPSSVTRRWDTIAERDMKAMIGGYQHMLAALLHCSSLCVRYGCSAGSSADVSLPWTIGREVPTYFANVGGESIFTRKVLSICGLRNLIEYGPIIYDQLAATLFCGDPSQYASHAGLSLMRDVTGNTVDLDTVVLRCSSHATLAAINASNRHLGIPVFSDTHEFASSKQAEEIAVTCAQVAIDAFSAQFKLSDAQKKQRKLHPSQFTSPIPIATDNTTRGKHPVWHYRNVGQDSFHANVPSMPDVVGALLKAPLLAIQQYAMLCSGLFFESTDIPSTLPTRRAATDPAVLSRAAEAALAEFFDVCIADSCFNGKWKAVEEYAATMEHRGTIEDVVQRCQAAHQSSFPASLFDTDDEQHTKEIALLWSFVDGLSGKDGKSVRRITLDDVTRIVIRQSSV